MKIKDDGQVARSDQLQKQFETTNFFKRLNDKFKIRTYRFDQHAERIERPDQMTFAGKADDVWKSATDLSAAGTRNGAAVRRRADHRRRR